MKYICLALSLLAFAACKEEEPIEETLPCYMQAESDLTNPMNCIAGSYQVRIRENYNSDSTGPLPPQDRIDVIEVLARGEELRIDGIDLDRRPGKYWEFYSFGSSAVFEAQFIPSKDSLYFDALYVFPTYSIRYEYAGEKQGL